MLELLRQFRSDRGGEIMEAFSKYIDESFPVGAKRTRSAIVRQCYADWIVSFLKIGSSDQQSITSWWNHHLNSFNQPYLLCNHQVKRIWSSLTDTFKHMALHDTTLLNLTCQTNTFTEEVVNRTTLLMSMKPVLSFLIHITHFKDTVTSHTQHNYVHM